MESDFSFFEFTPAMTCPPAIFENCPEYTPKDCKYGACGSFSDEDGCTYLKTLHLAKGFRTYFLAIIPLVLSIISIIANIIFALFSTLVLMKNGKSSKKRYAFLLSRSVSTIVAQILFYVVLISWKTGSFEYSSASIFILIGSLSFLTLTGTYLALSTLMYFAVIHPFWYRTNVTMARVVAVNVVIWILSVAFSICVGIYGATLFYPETAPISCSYKTCQQPLAIILTVVLGLCYFVTLIAYATMLIRMHLRNTRRNGHVQVLRQDSIDRNITAMNRLSFNLVSFAISKLPILIVCIVAVANLDHLKTLGNGDKSPCKTFLNGKLYFQVELLASIAAIVWLIGMISDPVINGLSDPNMVMYMKNGFHRIKSSFGVQNSKKAADDDDSDSNASDL
uniref:G_PROTEIN_RECEP_F1_2 domain-containing protein n=1 Tax=Panagrellus redivivus TaxID=6233 RepID=A0A7E4UYR0_PANRE